LCAHLRTEQVLPEVKLRHHMFGKHPQPHCPPATAQQACDIVSTAGSQACERTKKKHM
jgi:hypothetical protein